MNGNCIFIIYMFWRRYEICHVDYLSDKFRDVSLLANEEMSIVGSDLRLLMASIVFAADNCTVGTVIFC